MKKPCKYCDTVGKTIITVETADRIFIEVSGGYLRAFDEDYPGFIETEKINYCPMCGRDLWGEDGKMPDLQHAPTEYERRKAELHKMKHEEIQQILVERYNFQRDGYKKYQLIEKLLEREGLKP